MNEPKIGRSVQLIPLIRQIEIETKILCENEKNVQVSTCNGFDGHFDGRANDILVVAHEHTFVQSGSEPQVHLMDLYAVAFFFLLSFDLNSQSEYIILAGMA